MRRVVVVAALAVLLAACQSAPKRDPVSERLDTDLRALERALADLPETAGDLARARDAVRLLAATSGETARAQQAYIARQRVAIARAVGEGASAERERQTLERENAEILVEASRRDAELARNEAEGLRLQNLAKAEEADRLREDAATAQLMSEQSAADAEAARAQASAAKRLAEAQSAEAELAKREAELAMAAADSLRMQMQSLTARSDQRGRVMTLGDAVFSPGSSALAQEALANLDRVVSFVNESPGAPVRIEGHTDSRGGANLNQVLSQRRAEAVRDALVARGVDAGRITAVGLGSTAPVATNDSADGRARNRRVEIILQAQAP
jgi:outer membrane protein OmpA-like peptidoglycan-associated protein